MLLVCSSFLCIEEAGCVLRGQGDGQVTDPGVVGGADRGCEAEPGAGVDEDAGGCGGPLPGLGADLWLPSGTASSRRRPRSARGRRIWSLTYRSTVRCEMPRASAAARCS